MLYPGSQLNGTLLQNLVDISIWLVFLIVFSFIQDGMRTKFYDQILITNLLIYKKIPIMKLDLYDGTQSF